MSDVKVDKLKVTIYVRDKVIKFKSPVNTDQNELKMDLDKKYNGMKFLFDFKENKPIIEINNRKLDELIETNYILYHVIKTNSKKIKFNPRNIIPRCEARATVSRKNLYVGHKIVFDNIIEYEFNNSVEKNIDKELLEITDESKYSLEISIFVNIKDT